MATVNTFKNVKRTETFSAGQTIIKEGQQGRVMYVVQEGQVDIWVRGQVVETIGSGGVVGEMALLDDNHIRSATATAKTDCKLVPIDDKLFNIYVHHTPFFALQLMRVIADRVRQMNANHTPIM